MGALNEIFAHEVAGLVTAGDISAEEIARSAIERISERDPVVRAWVHFNAALALEKARAVDRRRASGEALGPLAGVPIGIKDIIDTKDWPTEYGSEIFAGRRSDRDAEVVRRLEAAGAVILGKTVTTELAFYGPGPTRNPRAPDRTPGGSSSGSAAAVADCHVPLALGSQTAGSIIRPASYCGVVGLKPTFGLVPLGGVIEQSQPLDTLGGYARSVADVALLIEVLSGAALTPLRAPDRPVRLAFIRTGAWPDGDPEMRQAMEAFAVLGLPDVACTDVELPPPFTIAGGLQRAVQFHDIARNYGPIVDENSNLVSEKLVEVVGIGRGVGQDEYAAALDSRDRLYAALLETIGGYDAIVTPAAQGVAPLGLGSTGSPMFNFLWTYLGMPAISLPLLEIAGLPLGVQLVGRRGEDAALLGLARRIEDLAIRVT
ncbi:MAG: amidase [Hyphomicrobium sp.]|nr:amidase [Hyphomicrobium sp.]